MIYSASRIIEKYKQSDNARELVSNSLWSILGTLFSKGLMLLSWIIVARILGTNGYGQFGIIRSTILMFSVFAGFSLGVTASKHVAEFISHDKEKAERIIGLTVLFAFFTGLVVATVFFILSPWLASSTLNAPNLVDELQISSMILFFTSLNGAQIGTLQGLKSYRKIAIINLIQGILSFPLFVFGALYLGVYGTVWAFAINYVIICILSFIAIRQECTKNNIFIRYREALNERKLLFTYSLPAFLTAVMVSPIQWLLDSVLVSSSGFDEMGLFTAAITINTIVLFGANTISAPFISIMSGNKKSGISPLLARLNILVPWALGCIIALPLIIFPEISTLLFGSQFMASEQFIWTLVIVLVYTLILMFKQGLGRLIIVYDLQWWSFFSNLIWGTVLIICFFSIERKSSVLLSMSYLIAYVINTVIILPVYMKRKLIPKGTIFSYHSLIVWCMVILAAAGGLYIDQILLRILIVVITFSIILLCFKQMSLSKK